MDELDAIEKAIIRKFLPWLVVGGMAIGGVGGSGVLRIDKFTASDAKLMQQDLEFQIRQMELEIRKDMPPICTRQRILNIEQYMEHKYPDFDREGFCW